MSVPEYLDGASGRLEVRTVESRTEARRADLLFVHGAWSSSWYWESFFLPWFAERGFRCRALSLQGHGGSEGKVRWTSILDYVEDVRVAAGNLDRPILIGHSMGGYIAQKYASLYPVRGLGLMASVAPGGVWETLFKVIRERPVAFLRTIGTLDLYGIVAKRETARSLLFSRDPSRTDKDHFLRHLQSESFRAFLDMLFLPVRKTSINGAPVTVIGAELDQIISKENVEATARFHGVRPILLPMASHMVPVDDRWREAATALEAWIARDVLFQNSPDPAAPN
ncbi:alpha/beta fold hydrolase [Sagittula sp. NFXS13]|uniref:alpha/beta fold hydrolase n=1 Tax=Sagittula sp. NFXS13 TaxID=2819095 RepID=UPI0032DFFECC